MGCGCGKKAARPAVNTGPAPVARPAGDQVQTAQTYQSGTMRAAPQVPVTRRTV